MYKNLALCIAEALASTFEFFMSVGCDPDERRCATVALIYKNRIATLASNYEEITLTCETCKIMERVVAFQMLPYLHEHCPINKKQYGFLVGSSTAINLLNA
jgi:hypothetical protein